mmetsp:Transcript_26553/g.19903  ORF Transcript_26553/g.19903 Transcript_26553/m.19903 type:complete len:268 (+) Transcript_26553:184-987(+)|eukprot:CAMPEP_0202960918 /NCGR_PEP_ID=MMETSP1396-20130829/5057_1 /ASSEMBLY_ACC=CAM_ASM_000872 /TAXON_ID= /ORGANISM="Pseudokeronopsis sp., Strain Brazil" /LENGTH=267 /DNA_ID=CAMNT_0049680447 /DNA_START=184 /DNA_END=987 /DNA_ORIENTATION=+
MQGVFQEEQNKPAVQQYSMFIQYLAKRAIDVNYIQNSFDLWLREPESVEKNDVLMAQLVYYFFLEEDYNRLFYLLNKTKNMEFLAIKVVALLKINRLDLAEQALQVMKSVDEDSCLTTLAHCWIKLHSNDMALEADNVINSLNELGDKNGYSTKTYNLLGLILIIKGQLDKALRIFENALNDLKLDSEEGQSQLYNGNNDLAALLVNYIKCAVINQGCGFGDEFFGEDELMKKLLGYLKLVSKDLAGEFFEDRKRAEAKFDEALKML